MKKHFVTFYSPGTFVPESSSEEIDSWDVEKAVEISKGIKERYGATPFSFRFTTRGRTEKELDSKVVDGSPLYFINCKAFTLADIKAENDPKNKTLISNMECNGYEKVARTTKGWLWATPIEDGDVVIND